MTPCTAAQEKILKTARSHSPASIPCRCWFMLSHRTCCMTAVQGQSTLLLSPVVNAVATSLKKNNFFYISVCKESLWLWAHTHQKGSTALSKSSLTQQLLLPVLHHPISHPSKCVCTAPWQNRLGDRCRIKTDQSKIALNFNPD